MITGVWSSGPEGRQPERATATKRLITAVVAVAVAAAVPAERQRPAPPAARRHRLQRELHRHGNGQGRGQRGEHHRERNRHGTLIGTSKISGEGEGDASVQPLRALYRAGRVGGHERYEAHLQRRDGFDGLRRRARERVQHLRQRCRHRRGREAPRSEGQLTFNGVTIEATARSRSSCPERWPRVRQRARVRVYDPEDLGGQDRQAQILDEEALRSGGQGSPS